MSQILQSQRAKMKNLEEKKVLTVLWRNYISSEYCSFKKTNLVYIEKDNKLDMYKLRIDDLTDDRKKRAILNDKKRKELEKKNAINEAKNKDIVAANERMLATNPDGHMLKLKPIIDIDAILQPPEAMRNNCWFMFHLYKMSKNDSFNDCTETMVDYDELWIFSSAEKAIRVDYNVCKKVNGPITVQELYKLAQSVNQPEDISKLKKKLHSHLNFTNDAYVT